MINLSKFRLALWGVLIGIFISEISLRCLGFHPFVRTKKLPTQYVSPDPEIGWINKVGSYFVTPSAATIPEHSMIILDDLSRNTIKSPIKISNYIDIFGCSFTHGGAYLRDSETYSSYMQDNLPNTKVRNFGVIGYSTYQMLLLMKRVLPERLNANDIVIYGLVDFHKSRNVATSDWMLGMTNESNTQLSVPFIVRDTYGVSYGIDRWVRFPLDTLSSLISLLELSYGNSSRRMRGEYKNESLLYVINEMKNLVVKKGGSFKVAYLAALNEKKELLISSIKNIGSDVIDCIPNNSYETYGMPEDRHPNKLLHKYWGQCIINNIYDKK